ncbi:MAG: phycobiliprotein lyase [Phormidesmis sp.]
MLAHFRFDSLTRELLMTTRYRETVSIDSITLLTPKMRLRRICNYPRPLEGQSLGEPELVGLGIEKKISQEAKTDTDTMRKVFIPKIVDLYGIDYAASVDKYRRGKDN